MAFNCVVSTIQTEEHVSKLYRTVLHAYTVYSTIVHGILYWREKIEQNLQLFEIPVKLPFPDSMPSSELRSVVVLTDCCIVSSTASVVVTTLFTFSVVSALLSPKLDVTILSVPDSAGYSFLLSPVLLNIV